MSETSTTTEVASQYAAQVAGDLERNAKEQERVSGEIATLQAQLTALQHDHTVLVNVQQALAATAPAVESATVPSPRKKTAAESGSAKGSRAKKSSVPGQGRTTVKKPAAKKPAAKKAPAIKAPAKATGDKSAAPTLVELVRRHLTAQSEPRSAAEVSAALTQDHPERPIQTTVVRNTLESLVAKHQAQRTKQGSSVYYTAASAPEPATASETAAQPQKSK
ncbi:hypothetical protein [Streptomyces sp. SCL15-6]|uniref:hypothetical protein n=1 Tax=Streptomyces sp. SCL15-6 TaxID=2967222 RepID=UPI0029675417|nr:hypothetical protein [Streptomyces sp. SCL15-6]